MLFQSWKPEAERDQALIERSTFRAGVMYDYLDQGITGKDWCMGEAYSMADCAASPALFYAQQVLPFDDRPNIKAYWQRLEARPSYQKVLAEAQPHLERLRAASA